MAGMADVGLFSSSSTIEIIFRTMVYTTMQSSMRVHQNAQFSLFLAQICLTVAAGYAGIVMCKALKQICTWWDLNSQPLGDDFNSWATTHPPTHACK